jgi:hypothetical protein
MPKKEFSTNFFRNKRGERGPLGLGQSLNPRFVCGDISPALGFAAVEELRLCFGNLARLIV